MGVTAAANSQPRDRLTTQPDAEQISTMIEQLGSSQFRLREQAHEELVRMGTPAGPALRNAAAHLDQSRNPPARRGRGR